MLSSELLRFNGHSENRLYRRSGLRVVCGDVDVVEIVELDHLVEREFSLDVIFNELRNELARNATAFGYKLNRCAAQQSANIQGEDIAGSSGHQRHDAAPVDCRYSRCDHRRDATR